MGRITLGGFAVAAQQLRGFEDALRSEGTRWMGTVAWYAHFPEFGTSKQAAEPFFRPGLAHAARDPGDLSDAFWEGNVLERLTGRAVEFIKEEIASGGLVRSGDLLASIADGKTQRETASKSRAQMAG